VLISSRQMKVADSSEISIKFYQTTRRHIEINV